MLRVGVEDRLIYLCDGILSFRGVSKCCSVPGISPRLKGRTLERYDFGHLRVAVYCLCRYMGGHDTALIQKLIKGPSQQTYKGRTGCELTTPQYKYHEALCPF